MRIWGWILGGMLITLAAMAYNGLLLHRVARQLEQTPRQPDNLEIDALRAEVQHLRRVVESLPANKPPQTRNACQ